MSRPDISLVISHTPWRPERVTCLRKMLHELVPLSRGIPFFLNDEDHRGKDWQGGAKMAWMLAQWTWSARQSVQWCVFATDDLALAPRFLDILAAMLEAVPDKPIGLLSNAPRAPELADAGHRWYRTGSWIVGPMYVLPAPMLRDFLRWYEGLPIGEKIGPASWNDDNAINQWVSSHGPGESYHPLPTPIEHDSDGDLPSTVGHGDQYSRERVSWRRVQHPASGLKIPRPTPIDDMVRAAWWREGPAAPLLPVGDG